MARSISTIILFALNLAILVLLVLLYKGQDIFEMTENDTNFLASDSMKWTIILLAILVVVSVLIDLYFSLAVRTFYLNLANGGEMTEQEERAYFAKIEREKRDKK
jgi:hypothetical protein